MVKTVVNGRKGKFNSVTHTGSLLCRGKFNSVTRDVSVSALWAFDSKQEGIPASNMGLKMYRFEVKVEDCPRAHVGAIVPDVSLQPLGSHRLGLE